MHFSLPTWISRFWKCSSVCKQHCSKSAATAQREVPAPASPRISPREVQHQGALGTHLRGLWEEERGGQTGDKQVLHGLAKARAQATQCEGGGKLCGGCRLPSSLGLLGKDRDSFFALRSEGTGVVMWYNGLGWGANSMKWGFKAHMALMMYDHHKEGLDNIGWRFPSLELKCTHLLMQDAVMEDSLFVGCKICQQNDEKLKLTIL